MKWAFKRVFYGKKNGLSLKNIKRFLGQGYCFIPYTVCEGYWKAVYQVGDHDDLYTRIEKPFPDGLLAHQPEGRFALHLSGGYDSSVLAKLYDRENVDFIHFTGPESEKARALAATLKGTLHEIKITPQLFLETADKIVPLFGEPYAFEDIVYAYIASKKAKELGHTLVVSGDGAIWGGVTMNAPYIRKALVPWKTVEPNRLLGLETLQPYMHTALYAWSETTPRKREFGVDKPFARDFCRKLGIPEIVANQKKAPWAGSLGIREDETVVAHMNAVVDNSDYRWIRDLTLQGRLEAGLLFRQYGLVKWLEANYKEKLDKAEVEDLQEEVRKQNALDAKEARKERTKESVREYVPRFMVRQAHRVIHYFQARRTK